MATMGKPKRRDWSALADLPLSVVSGRLHSLKDFLSFRGVCRSWRSVGVAMEGDVLTSHPPLFLDISLERFFHPGEKRFYRRESDDALWFFVGLRHGHLIMEDGKNLLWLSHYLTGAQWRCFPRATLRYYSDAIISSPPTSPGCVLVVYGGRNIEYCRPGDEGWCVVEWPKHKTEAGRRSHTVRSVAVVGGKGYVWVSDLGLASFDLTTHPTLTVVAAEPPSRSILPSGRGTATLVESKGELFAFSTEWNLQRGRPTTIADSKGEWLEFDEFRRDLSSRSIADSKGRWFDCDVYRFDLSSCKWVKSGDLGGRALLLDRSMRAHFVDSYAKWGGSKDCIYVCDIWGMLWEYKVKDATFKPFLFPFLDQPGKGFWFLPR